MTKRCRWRMASRMAATGSAIIRVGNVRRNGCFGDLLQQLLDPVLMSDALVEHERHFRRPAQSKSLANLVTHEPRGTLERARGVLACGRIAKAGVEHARVLQVRTHVHPRNGDESDAGIMQLPRNHRRHFGANLIGDAFGSGSLSHKKLSAFSYQLSHLTAADSRQLRANSYPKNSTSVREINPG